METFSDEIMRVLLAQSLEPAVIDDKGWHDIGEGPGSAEGAYIDWLTIGDRHESVRDDVQRIRSHPLVPQDIAIYGFIYDVKTGALIAVPAAMEIGKAA